MVSKRPCFLSHSAPVSPMSNQSDQDAYKFILVKKKKVNKSPWLYPHRKLGPPSSFRRCTLLASPRAWGAACGCGQLCPEQSQAPGTAAPAGWATADPASPFLPVRSEAACKQQDFLPAESPFWNNITHTLLFSKVLLASNAVFLVLSSTLQDDQGDLSAV